MTTTLQQPRIATELRDQIKKWILMRLGHPIVKVEVTNANLDIAIDEAVRRFSQWVPGGEKIAIFEATYKQSAYDLNEILTDWIEIKEVIYHPSVTDVLLTSFLGGITTDFSFGSNQISYFHGTYSTMTDYTLWNMYNEQYLRTIGREGTWQLIGNNTLYLFPSPATGVKVGIIYNSLLIDQDIRRDEWIKEWALSEIKYSIGSARRKYGSLPGPRGDISMDGSDLVSEAKESQETLRERLNEFIEPIEFITG